MKKQLTHISVLQSSKVVAALYFVITLPFAVILLFVGIFGGGFGMAIGALFAPFLYAIVGFIVFAILSWVYNLVAARIGGIEVTVTDLPAS